MPQNYGLLEKKQAQWRKDIDILLGRRVPDTTHHDEFPSAYRTAVRQPPSPPPAACLRPRRRYSMSEKTLPCGEIELCIHCEDPPTVTEEHEVSAPCTDRLLAVWYRLTTETVPFSVTHLDGTGGGVISADMVKIAFLTKQSSQWNIFSRTRPTIIRQTRTDCFPIFCHIFQHFPETSTHSWTENFSTAKFSWFLGCISPDEYKGNGRVTKQKTFGLFLVWY